MLPTHRFWIIMKHFWMPCSCANGLSFSSRVSWKYLEQKNLENSSCILDTAWVMTPAGKFRNIFIMDSESAFSLSEWSVPYNEVCSNVLPIDTSPRFSHILDDILKSSGSIFSIDPNPNSSLVISLIDGSIPPVIMKTMHCTDFLFLSSPSTWNQFASAVLKY